MRRILLSILVLGMMISMAGCGEASFDEEVGLYALNDYEFSENVSNNKKVSVNVTEELMDEIMSSVEVFGYNLVLPIKESDLPEGFTMRKYEYYENEPSVILNAPLRGNLTYCKDGAEISVRCYYIVMPGSNERIITKMMLYCDNYVDYKILGLSPYLDTEELIERLGEGELRNVYPGETYESIIRQYSDGKCRVYFEYKMAHSADRSLAEDINGKTPYIVYIEY